MQARETSAARQATAQVHAQRGAAARRQANGGDIAAEVFERLEQRQSLAEIVIGVRVEPEVVRELHRQWQLQLGPRASSRWSSATSSASHCCSGGRDRRVRNRTR